MSSDYMPVPKPKSGEEEDDYISRCMSWMADNESDRPRKQQIAICFNTWRESKKGSFVDGDPIPILRAFESEGKKYIYGYAAIFDSPDFFGTIITKELVESSMPHLRKFPAVRFMHKTPLAQIRFDKTVDGLKTFIDEHGFHVLTEVYDECEKEWNMIRRGGWGFSYGLMPARDGIKKKCFPDGKCFDAFVKGTLYEISVVDAPAHSDAVAYVIRRIVNGHKGDAGGSNPRYAKNKESEKNMNEDEIKQLLKDAEKRILAAIDKKIKGLTAEPDEEIERKLNEKIDARLAEIDVKLTEFKAIQDTLKKNKETVAAITDRIAELEGERASVESLKSPAQVSAEVKAALEPVTRELADVKKKLEVIENIPELRSPATGTKKPVRRGFGHGFGGMLDAAIGGEE